MEKPGIFIKNFLEHGPTGIYHLVSILYKSRLKNQEHKPTLSAARKHLAVEGQTTVEELMGATLREANGVSVKGLVATIMRFQGIIILTDRADTRQCVDRIEAKCSAILTE